LDIRAIGADEVAVPIEAPLPNPPQIPLIGFVAIHVHQTIPFLISVEPAQHIGKRPDAVAEEVHTVVDRLLALLDVRAKIRDPRLIVHPIIGLQRIEVTQPILRDQDRQWITAGEAPKPYS
jgi:hypothetical protein